MVRVLSPDGSMPTRYEKILQAGSANPGDMAGRLAAASRAARAAVRVTSAREEAIRDVAAGVAGPALAAFSFGCSSSEVSGLVTCLPGL
jgi:hypothetical protein